jgi:hypothetical protein
MWPAKAADLDKMREAKVFNKRLITTVIAFIVYASAGRIAAQQPQAPQQGRGGRGAQQVHDYGWKSEEYLLLGDANRGGGEPMIAVDPTNPKNIVVDAMASLQQLPPEDVGRARENIPRSTITSLAVTHNGGITWEFSELPMLSNVFQRCPDPIMYVTKDGTFLGGCESITTVTGGSSASMLMVSPDKGESWGPRAELVGQDKSRFAPGIVPAIGHAAPFDRPFLAIDDSTGTIYAVAEGGTAQGENGKSKPQAYITASTDGGKSFGTIYAWDSNGKEYPQLSRGMGEAAGFGEVAVIYVASSAPAAEHSAPCPCAVVGLSRDLGRTFSYHVIKGVSPATNVMSRLTADPTQAGRYSTLSYVAGPNPHYEVITSEDHGRTWSQPVNAGSTPDAVSLIKPAFRYSGSGLLALMWRAVYQDGTYDIWSSISKDAGKTFSSPVRVSHAKSPATDPIRVGANDDISDIAIDGGNIHVVWGDYRPGFEGVFYGRVAISAYEFSR